MNASELADAMETRASIRRKATSRKSVQENANDRLADQLEQAATMLRQQKAEIEALKAHLVKELPNNHQYIAQLEMTVRNQQAEIEALKLQLHSTLTNRELRTYDGELK